MARLLLEQRLEPLGSTFLDYKDEVEAHLDCTGDAVRLSRTIAVRRFGPSRLRRRHSIGGYVPHALSTLELPHFEAKADEAAEASKAWPDTDDDGLGDCASPTAASGSPTASWPAGAPDRLPPEPAVNPHAAATRVDSRPAGQGLLEEAAARGARAAGGHAAVGDGPTTVTTLMVRNLPRTLTQRQLLSELDRHGFADQYDFVYVPSLFSAGECKGYAFVNFTSAEAAAQCMRTWNRSRQCAVPEDMPPLSISAAELQGLEANVRKWSKPRMNRIRNPLFRPFVRSSASDGGTHHLDESPGIDSDSPSLQAEQHAGHGADDSLPERRPRSAQGKADITTLMLRNLPPSLLQQDLAWEIDLAGFAGAYDFLYLPSSFGRASKGYAFVNFVTAAAAARFVRTWHQSLPDMALSVLPAEVQGLGQNLARWAGSRLGRIRNPGLRPMVLAPVALGAR